VAQIRDELTAILRDLDRRRHELMDWRLQMRRHPVAWSTALGVLLLLAGGAVALAVSRRRRAQRAPPPIERLRRAFARTIYHPDLVTVAEPSLGQKALATAVSGAVAVLSKAALQRLVVAPLQEA
jgi:hypothetical protein